MRERNIIVSDRSPLLREKKRVMCYELSDDKQNVQVMCARLKTDVCVCAHSKERKVRKLNR